MLLPLVSYLTQSSLILVGGGGVLYCVCVCVTVIVEGHLCGGNPTFEIGCVGFESWGAREVVCSVSGIGTPRQEKE